MATYGPTNTINLLTNDADFQTWVTAVHNVLAGLGSLTQASDTGQIAPASVSRPSTSTSAGYEIWKFNDALQATAPIYIKVEYGIGTTSTHPSMWITVGTGSDGAGTLNGNVSTRKQSSNGTPTGSEPLLAAGADGRVAFFHQRSASGGIFWTVQRPRGLDNVKTSDGAYVCMSTTTTAYSGQMVPNPNVSNIPVATASTTAPCTPFTGGISNDGTNIVVSQHVLFFGQMRILDVATVNGSDLTSLSTATIAVLGQNRTYIALPVADTSWNSGVSTGKPAILFE